MFQKSSQVISSIMLICSIWMATTVSAVNPAKADGEAAVLEFYMHDILGGSNPTARPITGLLGNIYSGQVPFVRPLGFSTPKDGVIIPNANGATLLINANTGIPLGTGTGLAGTAFGGKPNDQNQNNNIATQLGPDGLGLVFGTITVIDDLLTSEPDLGSQAIGKAQGLYVASSADGTTQMMAFTAMEENMVMDSTSLQQCTRSEELCHVCL